MKTICFLNFKGGVGKTITAATLAYLFAQEGRRVLLIDADSQGNLSQFYGVPAEDGTSTLDLLSSGADYYPDFVTPTRYSEIDIIPADIQLISADVDALRDGKCRQMAFADLRDAIDEDNAEVKIRSEPEIYDFILIDCPPALTAACAAALSAADEVIIPIRLDAFSTAGMAELRAQITNMRRINDRLRLRGVLVTQYTRTPEEQEALGFLRKHTELPVFRTVIRYSKRVGAATFARKPLPEFSPWCAASLDYRSFYRELTEVQKDV